MEMLKKKWPIICIFSLFFLFLVIQHHYISLYHDDYGYLSLTYYIWEGPLSMHFEFSDIIHFLSLHYVQWGGRIFGFFYEIFFAQMGIEVYHIFQSLMITGVFVFIYLIATKVFKERNVMMALFTVFSYGLFEIMQLRSGIYWITASCLYIVPLFFLFGFLYFYMIRDEVRFKHQISFVFYDIMMGIFIFLATFSQEQIAAAMVVMMGSLWFLKFRKSKKIPVFESVMLALCLMAFGFLMLAPGNKIRMEHPTSAPFYALSLYGKLRKNIPEIVVGIFGKEYRYFTGIFFFVCAICSYFNLKSKKGFALIHQLSFLLLIFMVMGQFLFPYSYFQYFKDFFGDHLFLLSLFFIFHLIVLVYTVIFYFVQKKDSFMVILILGAIVSQGVMLVSPYYTGRCAIIFNLICFIFMIYVLCDLKGTYRMNLIYLLLPFLLITSINLRSILIGYYENSFVNHSNEQLLLDVSSRIKNGENVSEVVLQKLPNILYSSEQPYQEGYEYILDWMKSYYELPSSIVIRYE